MTQPDLKAEAAELLAEWLRKFGRTIRLLCDGDLDERTADLIRRLERSEDVDDSDSARPGAAGAGA